MKTEEIHQACKVIWTTKNIFEKIQVENVDFREYCKIIVCLSNENIFIIKIYSTHARILPRGDGKINRITALFINEM